MRSLVAALLLLALSGCTAVVVKSPIGADFPNEDSQSLVGVWTISANKTVTLHQAETGELAANWDDDGKPRTSIVRFTELESVPLVWIELEPDRWFIARILALDENAFTLLAPDVEEVQAQIAAGALSGKKIGDYLLLEETGLAEAIATKQFWNLDGAWPLIRLDPPAEPAP